MPQLRMHRAYFDDVKIHDVDDPALPYGLRSAKVVRPPRSNIVARTQADGIVNLTHFYDGAIYDLEGYVRGVDAATTQRAYDELEARMSDLSAEHTLRWLREGLTDEEQADVKLAGLEAPAEGWAPKVRYAVTLQSQDPRAYGATLHSNTYDPAITTAGGGAEMPLVFPLMFSGTTSSHLECVNNGGFQTPPRFEIRGPASYPIIDNDTSGQSMQIAYELGGGDVITVDVRSKSVLLNGVSRPDLFGVGSPWITLVPGTNRIRLRGLGFIAGQTQLTVYWRDAR